MAQVIQIGKRRWVAGLSWNSFEDAPSKEELKDDANRLDASWACVRIGESAIQAGFCAPIEGISKPNKLHSLAAILADSREQPWLGTFKIEDGLWWYIAVRDGHAILPDGDIIGGEAEINAARDSHAGYEDWKYVKGDLEYLEELVNEVKAKPTPIRSLAGNNLPNIPIVVSAIALASAMGGGYWWWHQNIVGQEQARLEAITKMRQQLFVKQAAPVPVSPLLTTPEPNNWLAACEHVLSAQRGSQMGWSLDQVGCESNSAVVHWTRGVGATAGNKPEGDLSIDGDTNVQTIPLTVLQANGVNNAVELSNSKLSLRSWAQTASLKLTLTEPAPIAVLPGAGNPASVVPQIPQVNFTLDLPISPFGIDMSSIPGLRINSLKSTLTGWTMEGILYGR